jgi:hypothetical protein
MARAIRAALRMEKIEGVSFSVEFEQGKIAMHLSGGDIDKFLASEAIYKYTSGRSK